MELPPLASYLGLENYSPQFGDFVVWAGLFSTWFGVVQAYDKKHEVLEIVFGGLPVLLVTMDPSEQPKHSRVIPLHKIRNSARGTWAVIRHEPKSIVWYV